MKKYIKLLVVTVVFVSVTSLIIFQESTPSTNIETRQIGNKTEVTIAPNYRANSIYDFTVFSNGKQIYSYKDQNQWPFEKPFKFSLSSNFIELKIISKVQYDYWIAASITTETKIFSVKK